MKNVITYILILAGLSLSQDNRSTIFSTGTPVTEEGYIISGDNSYATKFPNNVLTTDYAMEAFKVTMGLGTLSGAVIISIHDDNNDEPGEVLGSWNLTLTPGTPRDYLFYTFQDCILFDSGEQYWISAKAADEITEATWIFSPTETFVHASSSDNQSSWETTENSAVGSCKIYAEAFYTPDISSGDVNEDYSVDVLDVVMIVSYVVGTGNLNETQFSVADINRDDSVDVLDIVQIVGNIVNTEHMPYFTLLDFNPNSDYYDQMIGPETFSNEVSCYYFGKQG